MSRLFKYLDVQKDRFLQGASVLIFYWILVCGTLFVFGALIIYAIFYRLFFIWTLGVIYFTWIYFVDLKTFSRGGRRVEFVRNNIFFKYMRDYYPVSLVKTVELDRTRNYIFCYHPHGVIPDGLAVSFGSEALQFSKTFPGIVPYIGAHSLIGFGQNDVFNKQPEVNFLQSYKTGRSQREKWTKLFLKSVMLVFCARFGMMPYPRPITVVVGSPIPVEKVQNPSEQQINKLHSEYKDKLKELFHEHRDACCVPRDTELLIQ